MKYTLAALSIILPLSSYAQLSSIVANSGSCTSQGIWTQKAIQQANYIADTVANLKNDPNCSGLADSLIKTIPADAGDSGDQSRKSIKPENLMNEITALKSVMQSKIGGDSANSIFSPILANVTLDSIDNAVSSTQQKANIDAFKNRFNAASQQGMQVMNDLFLKLPQYEKCLQERPDLAANLFMGSVSMAAAFTAGGPGVSAQFSSTLGNFLKFLQEYKYAKILKNLDQMKFWSDLSCLIETTQANYCSVEDGFQLIKDQKAAVNKSWEESPLRGYYIMVREVPEVSDWIQKIQLGIEPRLKTDAQFKNDTWASMIKLFSDTNDLPAIYYENYNTVYDDLTDVEQKRQNIRTLLTKLTDSMVADLGRGNTVNFFDQAVAAPKIPFFLLGRDEIPAEIIAPGQSKMSLDDYLQNLEKTYELKNPDEAMSRIIVRLKGLVNRSMIAGAAYFRKRMSVDQMNLIDESITNSAISSRQAMINVRNYLKSLYKYLENKPDSQPILVSIVDTMSRLDLIIESFEQLDALAGKLKLSMNDKNSGYSLNKLSGYANESRAEYQTAFENVISLVYLQLNILLQRDSFFSTRIGTYVRHEYFVRAKNNEDFSQYTDQVIMTAGRSVIDQLQQYQNFNIAAAESDLKSAQVINMNNLDRLEEFVTEHIESYLFQLNKRAGNNWAATRPVNPFVLSKLVLFAANQDENGAAEGTRSKICMQTLGFKNFKRFVELCRGAKLESSIQAKNGFDKVQLTFNYNELFKQKYKEGPTANKILPLAIFPASNRYQHTCVLRDYFRNNLVSLMTQNFNSSQQKK